MLSLRDPSVLASIVLFLMFGSSRGAPLDQEASLVGRVIDAEGRALSSVVLTLVGGSSTRRAVTDEFGAFQFQRVEPLEYLLTAEKTGFVSSSHSFVLEPELAQELEVVLESTASLTVNDRVTVVGNPAGLDAIPGTAQYIDTQELRRLNLDFGDVHSILRQIPGVNLQEEEGFGLRPNIGFRGSGTERSSSITLMEDGVLIAPAPYAAPAAYYFPTTGRMNAVEVRKGSSQIKYGPRTNGGALNLLSTPIPDDLHFGGTLALGEYSTGKLHAHLGDSYENAGWMLETFQMGNEGFKQLDGGGDTGFDLKDYVAKFRLNSGVESSIYHQLEVKVGYTDQDANETYLGLTDEDFRANPLRRYRASQHDFLTTSHEQYQARYFVAPGQRLDFTATVYRNNFNRNWYKLQSVSGSSLGAIFGEPEEHAEELSIIRGEDSPPDALQVRANYRSYYSQGVDAVVGLQLGGVKTRNLLQFGLRYHEDQEDRFQHQDGYQMREGSMIRTSSGAPGSNANRIADAAAWAFFLQDNIRLGRLQLVPGVRYESIELVRTDFATNDPERNRVSRVLVNHLDVLIPGVGASYQFNEDLNLFGGIHKGFAPPGPGSTEETRAENSFNYEIGLRVNRRPLKLMVAAFYNDYENLLGADSLSSGGTGEGDLYNGGAARVAGLETSVFWDAGAALESRFRVPVRIAYTLTDSEFRNDFESGYEPWGSVHVGDEFPYLSRHQFFSSVGLEGNGWRTRLEAVLVGRMRTAAGQGPHLDALSTDSTRVFNVSAEYDVQALQGEWSGASLFLSLRNLGNDESIVGRHPAGARPGLPRTFMGGIRFRLGR